MTIESRFLQLDDFLSEEEHRQLLDFALGHEHEFTAAEVSQPEDGRDAPGENDPNVRQARVAPTVEEVFPILEEKLVALLPHARIETGVPRFELGEIERQLTAHGDGDFFEMHLDTGGVVLPEGGGRRLSYVYYFNEEPRGFEGGELRLYDQVDEDGERIAADTYTVVEPKNNSIVFFPSDVPHEVCPVRATGDAGTTRFTINGWFRDEVVEPAGRPMSVDTMTALQQRYTPTFTSAGFRKLRTPPRVHAELRAIYDERVEAAMNEDDYTSDDGVYLQTGTPDFIIVDDVKQAFHDELKAIHEAWSGVDLVPTAAYGLRVYREGQTLRMHTDRLETHVISSIVHIAHDGDDGWPLQFVDIHGTFHNVVLEEGEMLLYESARCAHGRITPFAGNAYCSLFLHYAPPHWNHTLEEFASWAEADGAYELFSDGD